MRILRVILTVVLLASLAACCASRSQSDVPVDADSAIISYAMAKDGATVRVIGKTFQVTQQVITWDRGGSLNLTPNWGLLELRAAPNAVDIMLDGVIIANVAK